MRFLFVDRILSLEDSVAMGLKHVTREDYYLCLDQDRKACFIPSLVGETIGQLAAWHVMKKYDFQYRPVAGVAGLATVHRPVYLGESLRLETTLEALDTTLVQYHGEAYVGSELVFSLESALGPLLPMDDFIDPCLARHQFEEIYRPVDEHDERVDDGCSESILAPYHTHAVWFGFDKVIAFEPLSRIEALKYVSRAASYFSDHFPRKPVLPMTVLLESFLNLAQLFIARTQLPGRYRCQRVRRVKMTDFILPGDTFKGTLVLKRQTEDELVFHARADLVTKRLAVLEIIMVREEL